MFEVVDFIYNDEERKVLVDKTDGNGDIYGFDLNLLSENFKKDKIKTNGNVKNPEEKNEEKPKIFEV